MNRKVGVPIENIINSVLLDIGDETNRRYYVRASQWSLDALRDINIHHNSFYFERRVALDPELLSGDYPKDLVKLLSVGIYMQGEFFPFTKKVDMSLMPVDAEDGIYQDDGTDGMHIPERGGKFGFRGANIGYYVEDPENCRFFVRNYVYSQEYDSYLDVTSDMVTRVVIRYKGTGIDCNTDICVPIEARDLIIASVVYKFMRKNIPFQITVDEKNRQVQLIDSLQDKYEALLYEPHNLWEVKDKVYGAGNMTARR